MEANPGQAALAGAGFEKARFNLRDRYAVPPFTVLDRRQGYWREEEHLWVRTFDIKSEVGREGEGKGTYTGMKSIVSGDPCPTCNGKGHLPDKPKCLDCKGTGMKYAGVNTMDKEMSVFSPVLCRCGYTWFCPPGGEIIDPFAGGSVRGIVAGVLGYSYIGVDLNERQVKANREGAEVAWAKDQLPLDAREPTWYHGDSGQLLGNALETGTEFDMGFTCPPYGDLEVYTDHPADLSQMDHKGFARSYIDIIGKAARCLKDDSFFAIVVGNYRDKQGTMRDLVGLTVLAFREAGLRYYNEAVIIDPVGTQAIRAKRQFAAQRKLVRGHQNFLVFVKGDPKRAAAKCYTAQERDEANGAA